MSSSKLSTIAEIATEAKHNPALIEEFPDDIKARVNALIRRRALPSGCSLVLMGQWMAQVPNDIVTAVFADTERFDIRLNYANTVVFTHHCIERTTMRYLSCVACDTK